MTAAKTVFAEKGYDAATTKEIALLAKCSETLIFKYFTGKKNLYEYIVKDFFKTNIDNLNNLKPELADTLEEELHYIFSWFFHNFATRFSGSRMVLSLNFFSHNEDNALKWERKKYMAYRLETFTSRLRKFQEKKQISPEFNPEYVIRVIRGYALMESLINEGRPFNQNEIDGRIKDLVKIMSKGLKP